MGKTGNEKREIRKEIGREGGREGGRGKGRWILQIPQGISKKARRERRGSGRWCWGREAVG